MRYRKKPVVIEAVRWEGEWAKPRSPMTRLEEMMVESNVARITRNADATLSIETLEGVMRANVGDYIILGVKGELYPCKPDIFEATYEAVPDESGGS